MISSDFHFRGKIPVAILGATGCVGQKLIQLLESHPWFEIAALCASERSVGKQYQEAAVWLMPTPMPPQVGRMVIQPCQAPLETSCSLVFSGLDSSVAGEIEACFAESGYIVVSNSSNHRMDVDVPLVIGEVNADHLDLAKQQSFKGKIITNPNCSVMGLCLALKPLVDRFGIDAVQITTMQAVSGAGYPGVASMDVLDNVIPSIKGEEAKVETEPLKILGQLENGQIKDAALHISAQCTRVPISDGHTGCVSIKLKTQASPEEIIHVWQNFSSEPQALVLPTAPFQPIHYWHQDNYPQPKLHRQLDKGMAVSIGRLRTCPVLDYKFAFLSHNTIRGAAGAALLNAELLVKKGWIYW